MGSDMMRKDTTVGDDVYPFRFSIITAVYNVEPYIEECIRSIVEQNIGFEETVQLILVDDGSEDRSGEICDLYAQQYPNNIIVVHKENGGVSSARNAGIELAKGRYINFCDPDDKLSPNTLQNVYNFFEKNDAYTDIVSIPIYTFGTSTGAHLLNDKFSKGTRLIYLEKECNCMQLSSASAFFKSDVIKNMRFDTELAIAEDAELIMRILIEKPCLGVVTNCRYQYRRYATSALANSVQNKKWYNDSLLHFSLSVLERAEQKYGYIPRFVQNTVLYDLRWKLQNKNAVKVLSEEELETYKHLLKQVIAKIDEDVWIAQKSISNDLKLYFLAQRYGTEEFILYKNNDIYYGRDYHLYYKFCRNTVELNFLNVSEHTVSVSLRQIVLNLGTGVREIYLSVNDQKVQPLKTEQIPHNRFLNDPVSDCYICEFEIPTELLTQHKNQIAVHTVVADTDIVSWNLLPGFQFPVTKRFKNSYYEKNGFVFTLRNNRLWIEQVNQKQLHGYEKRYLAELKKVGGIGVKKALIARRMCRFFKRFFKKEIWILSDRLNKAGDNGEALFRYLEETDFSQANYYYAINKGDDYQRLKPLGNVIDHSSWKYKLLFLMCSKVISSHADDVVTNPFGYYAYLYQDILKEKDFIFLQHGVTKDDLSDWLNRYQKNIKGFVCAAKPEYDSIIQTQAYHYTEKQVWLTGFPRFDRLYHDEKKYITIMPTWRRSLMDHMDRTTGIWMESDSFRNSEYYRFYNSLINDKRLLDAAKQYGYTICYMPHPNILTGENAFEQHPDVRFFTIHDEYRDVYAHSNLIVTDYSSAVFDFAYLHKPVVYTQFDKDEFFSGSHVYTKGYFDYERDGFGEVTYDLDSTVNLLIDYMQNGCVLKDKYRERIDNFFAFNDQNNCKRILDKILEMQSES